MTTRTPSVAIAGNPNAGKTTLFNALAGARQKVANYPGVTVERKEANLRLPNGGRVTLVDLPGCYSLVARSPEEQIAHDLLFGRIPGLDIPAVVVCVVDASNLERNLYLATQLRDQGVPLVIALNMMDLAREKGIDVDPDRLAKTLGCPVIPTVGRKGVGIPQLLSAIQVRLEGNGTPEPKLPPFIETLPSTLEEPVARLSERLVADREFSQKERSRAEALWALLASLEGDDPVHLPPHETEAVSETLREFSTSTAGLRKAESHARYDYIGRVIREAEVSQNDVPDTLTQKIDAVLLHPVVGPALLFVVFGLVFQSIYAWAGPLMDGVDSLFSSISGAADSLLPESLFKSLLIEGVIAGVGNTVIFLPQILILFLFLGLLEDSGYLSRAAFLLDRLMASVGLDGKSFVPLLSSFACAVPGIMATRTIPGRKDRLVTILIAPLMTCSARLPVYILVIGTVFEAERKVLGPFNLGGLVLLGLYLLGIIAAVVVAFLLKKTLLKSPKPVLLLELPTYKLPSPRSILLLLWDRGMIFLRRVGTVILALTVILWVLLTFPKDESALAHFEEQRAAVEIDAGLDDAAKAEALAEIDAHEAEALLKGSFGGQLGHLIEPVIAPLGFDWKMGIGIVASFAAREVFVSTMGVIYGIAGEVDEESISLKDALHAEKRPGTELPLYTPLVGLSLLIFYAFACQCMSTLAIVRRETLSWKWPLFMFGYMTVLAWVASFAVYQGGRLLGWE